jgi:hypothetical protein
VAKGLLSNLVIDEVAFCERGMNPRADMVLFKARRVRKRPTPAARKLRKEEDEPGSFGDHFEDARAMEIDSALDRRLHALLAATTEIMRADNVDREALVLAAVNDYAAAMNRDVPELFAGRLAKWLANWGLDGSLPEDSEIQKVMKEELELAGLAGDVTKGEKMDWLKKLSKEERPALDYVLAGTDPAEFFKGTSEKAGTFIVGLVKRAVQATTTDGELVKTLAELTKARAESGTDEGFDAIVKSIQDPAVRQLVEMQRTTIGKQHETVSALQKSTRRAELREIVKGFDCLPNESDSLLVMLEKADKAGILADLQKVLTSANKQAEVGKQLKELGLDSIPGEGSAGTPQEADEALMAKAVEIRKLQPTLSNEQAYAKACDDNPDLYEGTRTAAAPLQ